MHIDEITSLLTTHGIITDATPDDQRERLVKAFTLGFTGSLDDWLAETGLDKTELASEAKAQHPDEVRPRSDSLIADILRDASRHSEAQAREMEAREQKAREKEAREREDIARMHDWLIAETKRMK